MSNTVTLIWKQKILPKIIAYLAKGVMRLVMMTCRIKVTGVENFKKAASGSRCILSVWHNRVALIPEIMIHAAPEFNYAGFISNSRDGEIIATITASYKIGSTIRIAHDCKADGLKKMINHLKYGKEVIVVTPDGPKGPLYEVKPGVGLAAFQASAKVVPMCWESSRYIRLRSWDQMILPKPFSEIEVKFGQAVELQNDDPLPIQEEMLSITTMR